VRKQKSYVISSTFPDLVNEDQVDEDCRELQLEELHAEECVMPDVPWIEEELVESKVL